MTPDHARGDALDVKAGEVLAGRYRAERVIGRGETGLVIGATDLMRGGEVAIKMLVPSADETDLLAVRLRREAHLLAQLTSPHVVRVFDVDKHGHAVCMVMELLRGGTLAEVVRKRGPLPIDEAVGYVVQACDAIAEAHALGIVHRDLKPQNLFLADRDDGTQVVKVLDFGVSKQGGGAMMGLTATGAAVGSPLYTAVEQLRDASRVDGRADLWSLGLVLYFLLCRRNAFDADNPVALMLRIATTPPHPLRERRPEVPEDLEAAIFQCVEKDPSMRFQNVAAFTRALLPFAPPWAEAFLASIEARTARRSLPSLPPVGSVPPPVVVPSSAPVGPRGAGAAPVRMPVPAAPAARTPVPPAPVKTPVPPAPVKTPVPPAPGVGTEASQGVAAPQGVTAPQGMSVPQAIPGMPAGPHAPEASPGAAPVPWAPSGAPVQAARSPGVAQMVAVFVAITLLAAGLFLVVAWWLGRG